MHLAGWYSRNPLMNPSACDTGYLLPLAGIGVYLTFTSYLSVGRSYHKTIRLALVLVLGTGNGIGHMVGLASLVLPGGLTRAG
jgi:hypothetical protein